MQKKYFPIFIDISEKKIVVIGGGVIATRRVKTLLEFASDITVMAPEVTEELKQMITEGKVVWIQKEYRIFNEDDDIVTDISKYREVEAILKDSLYSLQEADIVIAATNSPIINHQVRQDCRNLENMYHKSILVSVVDDKNLCDFYFPSIVQTENIVVGINSGGDSPKKTKEIRKKVEDTLKTESVYLRLV